MERNKTEFLKQHLTGHHQETENQAKSVPPGDPFVSELQEMDYTWGKRSVQ